MKAKREQIDGELMVIKLFASNYARDLVYLEGQWKNNHDNMELQVILDA